MPTSLEQALLNAGQVFSAMLVALGRSCTVQKTEISIATVWLAMQSSIDGDCWFCCVYQNCQELRQGTSILHLFTGSPLHFMLHIKTVILPYSHVFIVGAYVPTDVELNRSSLLVEGPYIIFGLQKRPISLLDHQYTASKPSVEWLSKPWPLEIFASLIL